MMPPDSRTVMARLKPAYAVVFSTGDDLDQPYVPYVLRSAEESLVLPGTQPHGLDADVVVAIPGLWYCLHLPATLFDLLDLTADGIKTAQALDQAHHIVLAPIEAFTADNLGRWPPWTTPTLVVCPDELADEASERSRALGFALPVARYSELSDESVRAHWRAIHAAFVPDAAYLGNEPLLIRRTDTAPTLLPSLRLARQFRFPANEDLLEIDASAALDFAAHYQTLLVGVARLERAGATPRDAHVALDQALAQEAATLTVPVVLVAHGVSSAYVRQLDGAESQAVAVGASRVPSASEWVNRMTHSTASEIEASVGELLATHRSIARGGVGIALPPVPPTAFAQLAQLEDHFRGNPSGNKVWSMLNRISDTVAGTWPDSIFQALSHASLITAFTDFPVGLVRLPGDTDPMALRIPIAYQPLTPMTRALQHELPDTPAVYLDEGFRVLVAECIPEEDPVGQLSRDGWNVARKMFDNQHRVNFEFVDTLTVDEFRRVVAENRPDILVISAHGIHNDDVSLTGLQIGRENTIGTDLGDLPPVVLLSACTTAPRGRGAVSVADLLLRQGATTVLATHVPVDVRRDAILMARFFVYMLEVLAQREPQRTLLDVWHRTRGSNAVNDILSGNSALASWGHVDMPNGMPVLLDFMLSRSTDQLRIGSVYGDSERVLAEMASDLGMAEKFGAWIREPGYVPESVFYMFIGRPDRVYLASPVDLKTTSLADIRASSSE
jgi:hypothetical protein